ncbi:lipopolysaccharide ABC transporter substrate-binding protein LptA [Candidatus Profftia tarda]|uniref:Lipopolysaccharide export system protein LptA n=1 Tax=Candidatus Profftia tarda TaxID=1177216 RepID=A0A8E4F114_9ENTR|nr:lipopolysaccharide ABC transporter substrate-binding protein LptA [Candidatus Profftia tarda]CAD6507883.1 Lipopolysaccharide export system protein LptA [Candidatus Profftia tarda]
MRFKIKQKIIRLILTIPLITASFSVIAVLLDIQQPIHIESVQQFLNIQGNSVTFIGDVLVKQGTIKIHADKIIVTRPSGRQGKEIVDGYGRPVTFYQIQENGKPISCHGNRLRYELDKDLVILTGNAFLKQVDSSIQGDKITYLIKQQRMEALSDKGKHVTAILFPTKWKDKNIPSDEIQKSQEQLSVGKEKKKVNNSFSASSKMLGY